VVRGVLEEVFKLLLLESVNEPLNVFAERLRFNNNRHECVVHTANFRALSVVHTFSLNEHRSLVQSTRACVHLNTEGWYCPAVKYVSGGYNYPDVGFRWYDNSVIYFKEPKVTITKLLVCDHVRVECERLAFISYVVGVFVGPIPLVTYYLESHRRIHYFINCVNKRERWYSDSHKNKRWYNSPNDFKHRTVYDADWGRNLCGVESVKDSTNHPGSENHNYHHEEHYVVVESNDTFHDRGCLVLEKHLPRLRRVCENRGVGTEYTAKDCSEHGKKSL
jgi:hypothetical protein